MVPKFSAPLTKLIRTGEGIVLFAFNIVTAVLTAVGDVAPGIAVKDAAIFNAIAFASRQALKAVAALKPVVGEPIPAHLRGVSEADILAAIDAAAAAASRFQAQGGTPAADVEAGLSPEADTSSSPVVPA